MGGRAAEADFQHLFAEHPYILSRTLPLKLEPSDIRPLGRPGKSEPDFVAFPSDPGDLGSYGVIELKRPDTRLLSERRKGVLQLSADARTAFGQGIVYGQGIASLDSPVLMLGNRLYVFAIMGLSEELAKKLGTDLQQRQLAMDLPQGCQLIPYDTLLSAFSGTVPPRMMVLVPFPGAAELIGLVKIVEAERFSWDRFTLTEASLEFWGNVEARLWQVGGARKEKFIDRSAYLVVDGIAGGTLATESPAHLEFALRVLSLMGELERVAEDSEITSHMQSFIDAALAMLSRRPPAGLSDGAFEYLAGLAREVSRKGRSYMRLYQRNPRIEELEDAEFLHPFFGYDLDVMHEVHPFARFMA